MKNRNFSWPLIQSITALRRGLNGTRTFKSRAESIYLLYCASRRKLRIRRTDKTGHDSTSTRITHSSPSISRRLRERIFRVVRFQYSAHRALRWNTCTPYLGNVTRNDPARACTSKYVCAVCAHVRNMRRLKQLVSVALQAFCPLRDRGVLDSIAFFYTP